MFQVFFTQDSSHRFMIFPSLHDFCYVLLPFRILSAPFSDRNGVSKGVSQSGLVVRIGADGGVEAGKLVRVGN